MRKKIIALVLSAGLMAGQLPQTVLSASEIMTGQAFDVDIMEVVLQAEADAVPEDVFSQDEEPDLIEAEPEPEIAADEILLAEEDENQDAQMLPEGYEDQEDLVLSEEDAQGDELLMSDEAEEYSEVVLEEEAETEPADEAIMDVLVLTAADVIEGEDSGFAFRVEDGTAQITGYTGTPGENLTLPDKVTDGENEYQVTVIGAEAFRNKTGFTGTLTIPAGVTDIRHDAFYGCRGFTSLVFAEGSALTTIGKNAFYGCSGMKNALILPETVTNIGEAAFKNCEGFTGSWKLPAALQTLEKEAFFDCHDIGGTVTIPAGVTEIGDYCFYMSNGHSSGWQGVWGLSFAEGSQLQRIGEKAFAGNWYFTGGIAFPESVTEIGAFAFEGSYTGNNGPGYTGNLVLPSGIRTIGKGAFQNCGFGGDLVIPDSLAADGALIGEEAFDQAGFTGTLTLPASLKAVPEACFRNCDFTGTLTLPETLEEIGVQGFSGCDGFAGSLELPEKLTVIEEGAFSNFGGTGSLILPDTVTAIKGGAFRSAQFTGALVIPDSVKSIGDNAFNDCRGITSVKLPENPEYTTIESGLFSVFMASSYTNTMGLTGTIVIPDNVTVIEDYAFSGCKQLTGITLPAGLTSIGDEAFEYCRSLAGISFPDTLKTIGYRAFQNCTGLTGDLTIPAGVRTIEEEAFEGCSGLDGVLTITYGVQTIGMEAFSGCGKLRGTVEIPASLTSLGDSVFANCESLEGYSWPSTLTTIPRATFSGCKGLTQEIAIPDWVTSIGYGAFRGCSGLTGTPVIPAGMTRIEDYTFQNCSGLTGALVIPENVTAVGYAAFQGCSGFKGTLTIPGNVKTIDSSAFENCSGFTGELVIPEGVTKIYDNAFAGCSGFTGRLRIPESVISISYRVFSGCSGITSLDLREQYAELPTALFRDCTGLAGDLAIPGNISKIGGYVFDGCSGLTGTLTIPGTVTSGSTSAFYGSCFSTIVNNSGVSFSGSISADNSYYYVDEAGARADTIGMGTYRRVEGSATALTDLSGAVVTAAAQTYSGRALQPAPVVTLQGAVQAAGSYSVAYRNNVNAGTATVTVTGIESKGTTGSASGTFKISARKITPAISLSAAAYTYDGKVKQPSVTVKDGSVVLGSGSYTVSYATGRKTPGMYAVTVTMKGNYAGSGKTSFTINPKGTAVKSLTAGPKKITVKWKKQAAQVSGYEIQCSLKKNFKTVARKKTVSGASKTSGTLTRLKKGKRYYVRIRTYKTVGGKKYYSNWKVYAKTVKVK